MACGVLWHTHVQHAPKYKSAIRWYSAAPIRTSGCGTSFWQGPMPRFYGFGDTGPGGTKERQSVRQGWVPGAPTHVFNVAEWALQRQPPAPKRRHTNRADRSYHQDPAEIRAPPTSLKRQIEGFWPSGFLAALTIVRISLQGLSTGYAQTPPIAWPNWYPFHLGDDLSWRRQ